MSVPTAAGTKAFRTDSLRKGVRGLPLRNASRPERAPSNAESRTSRPYSTSDSDHVRKSIWLSALSGRPECTGRHYYTSEQVSASVRLVTVACEHGDLRRFLW